MIDRLIEDIKLSRRSWSVVVGIADGGLYASRKISRALNIEHVECDISWYDGDQKRDTPIVQPCHELLGIHGPRLIVDDLTDTGGTIQSFKKVHGFSFSDDVCVLFHNTKINDHPPRFYAAVKPDAWVVFPWEVYDEQEDISSSAVL
jgi:hypoxanthine phosphoribosyltransferase